MSQSTAKQCKIACLYSKDSDKFGRPPSIIRALWSAFGLTTKANQSLNTSHLICFPLLLLCSGTKIQFHPFCQLTIICRMILIYITTKDEVDMPLIKNIKQRYDLIVETDNLIHFKSHKNSLCTRCTVSVLFIEIRRGSVLRETIYTGRAPFYNIFSIIWISIIHFWTFVIISVLAL